MRMFPKNRYLIKCVITKQTQLQINKKEVKSYLSLPNKIRFITYYNSKYYSKCYFEHILVLSHVNQALKYISDIPFSWFTKKLSEFYLIIKTRQWWKVKVNLRNLNMMDQLIRYVNQT